MTITQRARDYLFSYIFNSEPAKKLERPSDLQFYASLDDCRELLRALGNPQQQLRIVHVAGTNGKGSTCALITAALSHAGHRVGQLSSPHLIDLRERIRLGRQWIPEEDFAALVDEVRPVADAIYLGEKRCFRAFGQLMLALGLLWLARVEAEVAVVETGYGGTYDNSNVLASDVSVIAAIDIDHKHLLGPDLLAIAAHKAGIIKPGIPVVAARQAPEVERLLRETAERQGAELCFVPPPSQVQRRSCTLSGSRFHVERADATGAPRELELAIPLVGTHQVENALLALEAALALERRLGRQHQLERLAAGLGEAHWPGRCELRRADGRPPESLEQRAAAVAEGAPLWLLDGAHNPSAVRRLAETLREVAADRTIWLLLGAGATKGEPLTLFSELLPLAERVFTCSFRAKRSQRADELARTLSSVHPHVTSLGSPENAVATLRPQLAAGHLLVCAGSLFLVGEVSEILGPAD